MTSQSQNFVLFPLQKSLDSEALREMQYELEYETKNVMGYKMKKKKFLV